MKRYITIVVYLFAHQALAQSALRLQHISVEDGLSQSSVNHILQDKYGFMWLATGDGLNRYDGKDFIQYKSSFNDTAATRQVYRNINSYIAEDKNNKLWLSTDAGIAYHDWRHNKSAVPINKLAHNGTVIGLDGDTLWSAVSRKGFFALDINSLKYNIYPFTDRFQANRDTLYTICNGIVRPDGLWIADKAGLLHFDKNNHTGTRVLTNNAFNAVTGLQDGRLLLSSEDAVYIYDPAGKKTDSIAIINEISSFALNWKSAVEDTRSHTIYLGAVNSGIICKLDLNTLKHQLINFQKGNINCMYLDRSENLWIGTEGNGAFKLDIKQPKFFCYTPNQSNSLDEADGFMVKSIYKDDSGNTWMGTYDKGLIVGNFTTHKQHAIALPFPADARLISTILKDSAGNIVTTISNRILWLDQRSTKIRRQVSLPKIISASPQEPIIFSLLEWKKGYYLAGTNIGVFAVRDNNGTPEVYDFGAFKHNPALSAWIYNLHAEKNGDIYIGKRNGFARIRIKGDTTATLIESGFPEAAVRHFYKSRNHPVLWMATEKGLLAYNENTGHFKVFDERNGLPNSSVYAILPQNDSNLWVSTNQGLSNLKVQYRDDTNVKVQFVNYTSKDGLQSNEFNTGSYFQSPDGTLYFGGIAGINWFNPNTIKPNPYKAIPVITAISVNNHLFATDTSVFIHMLDLPYNKNTISLTVKALEFTQPEQNQVAYKLEGLDKDWVISSNNEIRYPNLAPGTYTFLLKASNNEGIWNDEPLTMEITIRPPYWQAWWFRLLVAVVLLAGGMLGVRMYVRQKVRVKTRELEKQKALYMERLRISKDVHDDLGSGLSKISLMADIAGKKAAGNSSISNDIQHISEVSKELVDNMHDLIWILNPDNTTLEQLVARLREYCADYLENIPIDVTMEFPDEVPSMKISRDAQRNIFLTTKEAINNSIKHAGGTKMKITLTVSDHKLAISVADNGKGFDPGQLKGSGNGLRNMRQRIESIGGTYNINPAPNNTEVAFSVPFDALQQQNTTLM